MDVAEAETAGCTSCVASYGPPEMGDLDIRKIPKVSKDVQDSFLHLVRWKTWPSWPMVERSKVLFCFWSQRVEGLQCSHLLQRSSVASAVEKFGISRCLYVFNMCITWYTQYTYDMIYLYIANIHTCVCESYHMHIYIYARGGRFTEGSLIRILWMFKNCYFVVVKREFLKKSLST